MNSENAFKQMIDDLSKRKSELHQHVQEFQHLEREMSSLQQRACTDPLAQQKLMRVQAVMDGDFLHKRSVLIEKVSSLTSNMQKLTEMVQSIPTGSSLSARLANLPKQSAPKKIRYQLV